METSAEPARFDAEGYVAEFSRIISHMLPSGTVTFWFTDIEGSTARWELDPARMRAALEEHNSILSSISAEHSGRVFKTVGDAFCVAFSNAEDAAGAALAAQQTLARAKDPLMVRMAVHTASIQPTGNDYFGPPLNRVARLLGVAAGGQILVSEAARSLLPSSLPTKDLGSHALRDLLEPVRIWQLGSGEFPPVRGIATIPNNLPLQTTSFVGRDEEMRQIEELLDKSRVITLTGTGGTGKTRLALQFAAETIDRFPDGVWLCELAALPEREEVMRALVAAVGAPEVIGTLHDRLVMHMAGKKCLVVLDNCEHVLDAAAAVGEDLIMSCASVTLLATSREPLGMKGEIAFRVPSLPAPDNSRPVSLVELESFGSTALFMDRLKSAAPAHELQESQTATITHICNRLDGIPLAIELAAARGRAMSLEQIEKRLDDRFRLLTGGNRNALSRQQTLRALIDWSVQLLSEQERRFLVSLSVFNGGWNMEACESVCAAPETGIEDYEVVDLLTALVDKSLVVYERAADRYRLLESIRQYALENLERGEAGMVLRDRHADHFLKLADAFVYRGSAAEFTEALAKFTGDYENFRMAVEWMAGAEAGLERAITAMNKAQTGFHSLGRPQEFLRLIKPLIAAVPEDFPPVVLGTARIHQNVMSNLAGSQEGIDNAVAMIGSLGTLDPYLRAKWGVAIAHALLCAREFDRCIEFILSVIDDPSIQDSEWHPYFYGQLGNSHTCLGNYAVALENYEIAQAGQNALGDERGCVAQCANKVILEMVQRKTDAAVAASLEMNRRSTVQQIFPSARNCVLFAMGHRALDLGDKELASILLGGGLAMREAAGIVPDPVDVLGENSLIDRVNVDVPEAEREQWMKKGRSIHWELYLQSLIPLTAADCEQVPNRHLILG